MRELKFRAWDKVNKRFTTYFNLTSQGYVKTAHIPYNLSKDVTEDYIVQQSTGLTDKNSFEIYEGDILRSDYRSSYELYKDKKFVGWSEDELDFYYLYEVIFYNGEFTVNCDEYTVLINGVAARKIYNSDETSSSNKGTINQQIRPLGLRFQEENYGAFGLVAESMKIIGNIFENKELLK